MSKQDDLLENNPQARKLFLIQSGIKKYLPNNCVARKNFDRLCQDGCDPILLFSNFLVVSFAANFPGRTIYDSTGTSPSRLAKIPDELEDLAPRLESVGTILERVWWSRYLDNSSLSEEMRADCRRNVSLYKRIPELLRVLAIDIRDANSWLQHFSPKRFDSLRQSVLQLFQYVQKTTKKPHYADISALLERFRSVDDDFLRKHPKILRAASQSRGVSTRRPLQTPTLPTSPAALRQLYIRSAKYGFREE